MTTDYYLTIDHGNSEAKYVLWKSNEIVATEASPSLSASVVASLSTGVKLSGIALGSVARDDAGEIAAISAMTGRFLEVTPATPMPLTIGYESRATLGVDRIAAAAGALDRYGRDGYGLLVVDAGTALTVDYVDATGCFRGGNIAPGITMQITALHKFTARLPLVGYPEDAPAWDGRLFGSDTASAITLGAIISMAGAVEYCIRRLPAATRVVLTGGSAPLLARHLECQAEISPRLVDYGLYRILLYNENR